MSNATGNLQLITDYTLHLSAERGLSLNTIDAYKSDLWQYAEIIEPRAVTLFSADKDDVAHFIHHLTSHDICNRSRARKIASLRRFYRWLILNERIDKDPMRLTTLPKLPRLLPRPVDVGTLREILERTGKRASADDATPFELRDHAMLVTMYTAGIRVTELCTLRQQDVALDAGEAHIRGKGGKERIVPLLAPAISAIENYLRFARPHLVKAGRICPRALFISEQGTQITRRRVGQVVCIAGGGEHLHPHRLRHSCATHMLNNSADLRTIQELLGHSNLGTTQIYTQVSKGHLQDATARFHPWGRQ